MIDTFRRIPKEKKRESKEFLCDDNFYYESSSLPQSPPKVKE